MKPFGYGPFETQRYKYFAGDGAAILIERCLKAAGDEQLTHFDQVYPYYREIFKENCMYKVKPCEGVPRLLRALKERGVKIAVLSNKPHEEAVNVVETLFGKGYFDLIQGQKPGIPIKPDPSGVFAILKEREKCRRLQYRRLVGVQGPGGAFKEPRRRHCGKRHRNLKIFINCA